MMQLIEMIRQTVRAAVRHVARWLERASGGRVQPNAVTIVGVAMHVPIALLIALRRDSVVAAALLIVFGLFDTLDGELARVQGRASASGMLLDAATDRMKETLLYTSIAFALAVGKHPASAAWAAAACGASLCVSYVKAKGEAAVASAQTARALPHPELNKLFKDGLLTFELRMTVLAAGLMFNVLVWSVAAIALLAAYTALQRLVRISRALQGA